MISRTKFSLTEKTRSRIFSKWLELIGDKECGSVVNLPKRDQLYRVTAFLDSPELFKKYLKNYQEFQFLVLDLDATPIEDEIEFADFLKKNVEKGKFLCLLVLSADELLAERRPLLSILDRSYRQQNVSIIYFFKSNISYSRYAKTISPFTTLYQNLLIFPFLEDADSRHFIKYLEKKFEKKIPKEIEDQIVKKLSGIPVLIKQACRYFFQTKDIDDLFQHPEMKMKLQIIWDEFDDLEKKFLEKSADGQRDFYGEDQEIKDHLLRTGILIIKKNKVEIASTIFKNFISKKSRRKLSLEVLDDRDIVVNGVIVNNHFSKRERFFLREIIKHKRIVRDQVANIIWNIKDSSYSDWALDQFISRIRKKLMNLGFAKDILQTIKNQGFSLESYGKKT